MKTTHSKSTTTAKTAPSRQKKGVPPPKATASEFFTRTGTIAIAATLFGLTLSTIDVEGQVEAYPVIVTPAHSNSGQDEIEQVRVGVFDNSGQRLLHAQVHGRSRLGALPAGEYRVEISYTGGTSSYQVKLGPGQRGIVRYELTPQAQHA